MNYSNFEYLNIPGRELNENEFPVQIFFQEKKQYSVTLWKWIYLHPVKSINMNQIIFESLIHINALNWMEINLLS